RRRGVGAKHKAARPAPRRTGEPDPDRACPDDPDRDRDEGVHRSRNATAWRSALGACGTRVRGLDGRALRRGPRAPLPDLVDRVPDGVPRRAEAHRGRRPLDPRSRVRWAPRCARHARGLPTLLMSDELLDRARTVAARAYAPYSNYLVGAAVRARDGRIYEGV